MSKVNIPSLICLSISLFGTYLFHDPRVLGLPVEEAAETHDHAVPRFQKFNGTLHGKIWGMREKREIGIERGKERDKKIEGGRERER